VLFVQIIKDRRSNKNFVMTNMKNQKMILKSRKLNNSKNKSRIMQDDIFKDGKYVLSYGGGINSTALIIHIVKNKLPLDYVIFSDTGDEMPETYEYVEYMAKYLKRHKIPFEIVKPRSTLSEVCIRRKVVPSQIWRWCTRDHKVRPIHKFYKKLGSNINQYMGIDYDEVTRMKPSGKDWITNIYPLIDDKIGREGCIAIIKQARLKIPVKSGCYFCPFNNKDRWQEIYENHPELYQKAREIEENNKHMPRQKLTRITLASMAERFENKQEIPMIEEGSPCGSECMI